MRAWTLPFVAGHCWWLCVCGCVGCYCLYRVPVRLVDLLYLCPSALSCSPGHSVPLRSSLVDSCPRRCCGIVGCRLPGRISPSRNCSACRRSAGNGPDSASDENEEDERLSTEHRRPWEALIKAPGSSTRCFPVKTLKIRPKK